MVGQDVLVLLVPALPLLGAVLIGTLRKLSAGLAGGLATTFLAGAFVQRGALPQRATERAVARCGFSTGSTWRA
jgi:hypothetical protein